MNVSFITEEELRIIQELRKGESYPEKALSENRDFSGYG